MKKFSTILFILFITISSCKKTETSTPELEDITSKTTFDSKIETGVSLIFFHASWCSNCKEQRPAVQEAAKLEGLSTVFFGQVEFEDNTDIVSANNVSGFPTLVIFKDAVEVKRLTGKGHSLETIENLLNDYL